MALIKCSECGREVSDKAVSCPHCGAPVAVIKKVPVRFWREKTFKGSAITGTVMVDGVMVGSAGNGTDFSIQLGVGEHIILIQAMTNGELNSNTSTSTTLRIPADAKRIDVKLEYETSQAALWLGVGGHKIVVGNVSISRY